MSEQEAPRAVWVRDRRTKAIVGYMTPDGRLIRLWNAAHLYQLACKAAREEGHDNAK